MVIVVVEDPFGLALYKATINCGCGSKIGRVERVVFVDKRSVEQRAFEFNTRRDKVGAKRFDFVHVDRKGQYVAGFEVLDIDG